MLSNQRITLINKQFHKRLPLYKQHGESIVAQLKGCTEEEAICLQFLYATMPLSDAVNYDFEMFLDYAKQGVKLRKESPLAKDLEEEIFLNYVLYHRINEEEISACRTFFYDQLKERVAEQSLEAATLAVNYWCCEEATYQSTDERTASAMTVFNGAYGRCGEESTFTVSALRSVGIPARQVYAPRWSHCDDNHAWVEVYRAGKWHFLGACEPEEVLDKGWFTNASSRAMLVQARWFDQVPSSEEKISTTGSVSLLNNLKLYAKTAEVAVTVLDKAGQVVEGAVVDFEILNYAEFYPIATVTTDHRGCACLTTGQGSIKVVARGLDGVASTVVNTLTTKAITLTLGESECLEVWEQIDFIAPVDSPIHIDQTTPSQKELGKKKFQESAAKRAKKVARFFKKWPEADAQLVELARGNYGEIHAFLVDEETKEQEVLKNELLGVLSKKDWRDVKASVLLEHFKEALYYKEEIEAAIFVSYVMNPRIALEPMTAYRKGISSYFSDTQKQLFKQNPKEIWAYILENITAKEEVEYSNLTTSPIGCLQLQCGSELSQKTLFVAICRTLGVPARLHPIDGSMEYYQDGIFTAVAQRNEKSATLALTGHADVSWVYTQNWSLGKWDGAGYVTLNLQDAVWDVAGLKVGLEPGTYRLITNNRLPNGNCFIYTYTFELVGSQVKQVEMKLREAKLQEMLQPVDLPSFMVKDAQGVEVAGKSLLTTHKRLFIWLEVSKEPTEHILNELYDFRERFEKMGEDIILFIRKPADQLDPTLAKVLGVLPNVQIYYDTFEDNIELLARRMYVDPSKLPLILVTQNEAEGLYATSGYNVGTGDMLLRILEL